MRIKLADPHYDRLAFEEVKHIDKDGPKHSAGEPARINRCRTHLNDAFLGIVVMEDRAADDLAILEYANGIHEVAREPWVTQLVRDPLPNLLICAKHHAQTTKPPGL